MTNKQKAHARNIARKRLLFKIKMERPFVRELKSYFAKQSKKVASGQQLETIESYLENHYARIVRNMTGIKIKQEEENDFGLEDAIMLILLGRAGAQALAIDKTTRKLLNRSIEIARAELSADGILFPSNETLNRTAAGIFKSLNRARPAGIAVSETQMLVEKVQGAKTAVGEDMLNQAIVDADQALAYEAADMMDSLTAREIADDIGEVPAGELFAMIAVLQKTWVTMGDSKVRPTHQAANFQTVPQNEPFIVGGALLMRPGDTSLGAPLEEVINCRCSSVIL